MKALRKSWSILSASLLFFSQAYGALPRSGVRASSSLGLMPGPAVQDAGIAQIKPEDGLLAQPAAVSETELHFFDSENAVRLPGENFAAPQKAALGAPNSRGPPPSRAIDYLKGLSKIRVYFSLAPGYGHQSATLSIVRRLRELGFRGEIEGVYGWGRVFDGATMPPKLGQLIPGFDPNNKEDQRIPGLGMTIRSLESFLKKSERVPLALTGGDDAASSNQARRFNADAYLRLAPFGWHAYNEQIWPRHKTRAIKINYKNEPFFVYAPGQERIGADYFARLNEANVPKQKAEGLALLRRELGQHDFLAAYGLHFFTAHMLHRLLLGISDSMDRHPELYRGRGVVIPLLLDIDEKVARLASDISDKAWPGGKDEQPVLKAANAKLSKRVQIASITDGSLGSMLQNLKQDGILLVKTGAVPPVFFEWLFAHGTLPPTLEGCNAENLARLLGIPFLPFHDSSFKNLISKGTKARAEIEHLLKSAQEALTTIDRDWRQIENHMVMSPASILQSMLINEVGYKQDKLVSAVAPALGDILPDNTKPYAETNTMTEQGPQRFERISDFISAAMTPDSPLRRMFADAKIRQDDYAHDKLVSAVECLFSLKGWSRARMWASGLWRSVRGLARP